MDEKGNIELLNIIEVMEDALDAALRIPLSNGKCVVDAERFQELLSDMRLNLPTELKQAKNLLNDRKNILYIARKEAEDTVKLAEERAKKILDQDELVRQAQARANEIVTQAQMQAREIKKATNEFVEQRLTEVENNLVKNLNEVRDTKKALRPGKTAN